MENPWKITRMLATFRNRGFHLDDGQEDVVMVSKPVE
jgi:hypothetical protein